jgi:hypothetical protein
MLEQLITSRYTHTKVLVVFAAIIFIVFSAFFSRPAKALTVTPRFEVDADPGQTVTTTLKVINEERQTHTYYLRTQNFNAQDETGNPSFTTRQEDLAIWIKAPLSITLGPGETFDLPIQIVVPPEADPGGHYAAIFFLSEPPSVDDQSGKVALGAKLGSLILLRVNGDFVQNASVLEFGTTGRQWFFDQLPVQFYYRFQNTGDDHQKPIGDILIKNFYGGTAKHLDANPMEGSVLPKSIRRFISSWTERGSDTKQPPVIDLPKTDPMSYWEAVNYQARHFVMGRYKAQLKVAFGSKEFKTDHAEFVFYVIPWQLLSIVIPLLIIILWLLRFFIKRYNRYIITRARTNQL